MTTAFNKIRALVLGNLHGLLDRVIDLNSPEVVKQYIRDLEAAIRDFRNALNEQRGTVADHAQNLTRFAGRSAELDGDIDLLLSDDDPSNDDAAISLQEELDELTEQVASETLLRDDAASNVAKMEQALARLTNKHADMVKQLTKITTRAAATKAKNHAADAVTAADSALKSIDGVSVDNLDARGQHDSNVADARFDDAMGNLAGDTSAEAVKKARALASLKARRAKIVQAAQSLVDEPGTGTAPAE